MALQDLTPQLRTRLNRMERAVGWFILLATLLLLFGFAYYVYTTAERKGWFKIKAQYYTYAVSGEGLLVGDPILLMGFPAGQITEITAMAPAWGSYTTSNVFIGFEVTEPYYGYLWTEGSVALVSPSGFLGKRQLNLSKGTNGYATSLTKVFRDNLDVSAARALPNLEKWRLGEEIYNGTNLEVKAWQPLTNVLDKISGLGIKTIRAIDTSADKRAITAIWNPEKHYYEKATKKSRFGLPPDETPALTERLQAVATQVEAALPNILALTNQLSTFLSNGMRLTSNFNVIAENARPMITNLNVITANLRNPTGSLGEWLIPTNINQQLDTTLRTAQGTLSGVDTNLVTLNRTLDNLGNITSNLNNQVQANTNILSNISQTVVHTDEFIQGLKRFWLFRRLFKTKAQPAHSARPVKTLSSPKQQTR